MKLKSTKKISKVITTFEVHPKLPGIEIQVTKEGSKIKEVKLLGKSPGKYFYPQFVKDGFWELIKKYNPWAQINHKYGWDGMVVEPKEMIAEDFVVNPKNFVWVYNSGNLLFDINMNPIPVPYCFDYIGTPFTNETCDLEKMLPYLKKHKWVTNGDELFIDDIPYYNNEGGWKQFIRGKQLPWISVLPPAKVLKEIYQRAKEINPECPSVAMKDLLMSGATYEWTKPKEKDYMGIRKFYKPHKKADY